MQDRLVVLKFGSSVLSNSARLAAATHQIYRSYRQGDRVIAVVSAIGHHTNLLLDEAKRISHPPMPDVALAQLLSTGEQQSAALLAMTLHRAGIPSEPVDATTAGIVLRGERLDAEPFQLDVDVLRAKLEAAPVLVLPGFIGRHEAGGVSLLGRGGSDLTAVFIADCLQADECRLVKDVDGIYEWDPAAGEGRSDAELPHRFGTVTYEKALEVAEVLVQPKAIEYLQLKSATARVAALLHDQGTVVGGETTTTADSLPTPRLKVLLLGLGVVGQGVYHHLRQLPEFFEVVGIHIRDPRKPRDVEVTGSLLSTDLAELLSRAHDLVVDVQCDHPSAPENIEERLKNRCAVVTANKRLVADYGPSLSGIAAKAGTVFRYSAAVGGGAPMIEAVERAAKSGRITALRGVLNGTCNYVLDRMAEGLPLDTAVVEAQEAGFAEAQPEQDLSGKDSEDKLRILARTAFGIGEHELTIAREGLQDVSRAAIDRAKARGHVIRLVAFVDADGTARVSPESLPEDDYLSGALGVENRLLIVGEAGQLWKVSGKGAGRWPSAEAVLADVLDIHAMRANGVGDTG